MEKPTVLILGKLPPPLMGPAVATEIILNSKLKENFNLLHFDTRINKTVADMGSFKFSKLKAISQLYKKFKAQLEFSSPQLVLVPIAQTSSGFYKDIPFIRMAAKSGAKVLLHLRGSVWRDWFENLPAVQRRLVLNNVQKADGVIVLGDNLRYIFEGIYPDEKIYVVPNGGDYAFPERKKDKTNLLYLANFLPGKALREVLLALKKLEDDMELPDYEFNAYGSWDDSIYQKQCEDLARNMPHVHLHQAISGAEKWQTLADADVFVFPPTLPEGHPWSLIEAAAAGLPIISTNRGAIRQTVVHGYNGFLLEEPSEHELAAAIAALLKDEVLRKQMAVASREIYLTMFTAAAMVAALKDVFHLTLALPCVES